MDHRIIWLISKDCISRSFILINSPTPSTFSGWKIRFNTQVSSCSGFPSEPMVWIKEVEMVDSVDEFKSSRSIQGYTHFPSTDQSVHSTSKVLVSILMSVSLSNKEKFIEIGTLRHQQTILPRNNGEPHSHLTSTSGSLVV